MAYTPKLDDVVIIFRRGTPVCHNSGAIKELGGDGCRGRVVKIGREYAYVSTRGAPWKVRIDGNEALGDTCLPVEQARARHAKNFQGPNEWRTPKFIAGVLARM